MEYRGRVKNGVVVFEDDRAPLRDGTTVRIEPISTESGRPRRGSREAIMTHAGIWAGASHEMDRLLAELKQSKQAELVKQTDGDAPRL